MTVQRRNRSTFIVTSIVVVLVLLCVTVAALFAGCQGQSSSSSGSSVSEPSIAEPEPPSSSVVEPESSSSSSSEASSSSSSSTVVTPPASTPSTPSVVKPVASQSLTITKAGSYGTSQVLQNVTIQRGDVTLSNKTINGNLVIESSVDDEDPVELDNVVVKGGIYIYGGRTVTMKNVTSPYTEVAKGGRVLNLWLEKGTLLDKMVVKSAINLYGSRLDDELGGVTRLVSENGGYLSNVIQIDRFRIENVTTNANTRLEGNGSIRYLTANEPTGILLRVRELTVNSEGVYYEDINDIGRIINRNGHWAYQDSYYDDDDDDDTPSPTPTPTPVQLAQPTITSLSLGTGEVVYINLNDPNDTNTGSLSYTITGPDGRATSGSAPAGSQTINTGMPATTGSYTVTLTAQPANSTTHTASPEAKSSGYLLGAAKRATLGFSQNANGLFDVTLGVSLDVGNTVIQTVDLSVTVEGQSYSASGIPVRAVSGGYTAETVLKGCSLPTLQEGKTATVSYTYHLAAGIVCWGQTSYQSTQTVTAAFIKRYPGRTGP